jgi:molecular chaperone GrpE
MSEKESAAERAIREALASVERIERERKDANSADEEEVVVLDPGEGPPSADAATEVPHEAPKKKTASEVMLEATLKAKGELQEVLTQTQKEAKDMFDRLARVSADFDNFKKRVTREKSDAIKFANEAVFKEMLPVLDNLQRAMSAGEHSEGVKLTAKQFEDVLAKFGVAGFPSLGMTFDPARHEAVGSRPDANVPAQHVCEEYQKGYMLHDRLLRPALVIVSSGPATEN